MSWLASSTHRLFDAGHEMSMLEASPEELAQSGCRWPQGQLGTLADLFNVNTANYQFLIKVEF